MQRWFLVLVLTLAGAFAASAADWHSVANGPSPLEVDVLQAGPTGTVLEYRVTGFEESPVTIGSEAWVGIGLAGEAQTQTVGCPALPDIRRSLLIPDQAHMGVRVLEAEFTDVHGVRVAPSKGPILRTIDPASVPFTFGAAYSGDDWYPSGSPDGAVSLGEPYILRDYRGAVLSVIPYQYHAASQTLRVYTRIRVEVVANGPSQVNVIDRVALPDRIDAEFARLYASHFVNWGQLRYTPLLEVGRMLIITFDSFHADVQPLADWKNQLGIPCEIVDKSVAGTTAAAIKTFIQNDYNQGGLTFVLLVGDGPQIPSFTVDGGSADPMYTLLAGSDNYPDAFVGRMSAENVTQLQTQVARTIGYERDPLAGGVWYQKGTGIASNQGPGDDGEYDYQHIDVIRTKLMNYTYTFVDQIYDPTATAGQVTNAVNDGRGIMNYCGHGWEGGWSSSGFAIANVNALTNDWKLPFIVSVACTNGNYTSGTCFAEAWLRATHNGNPTGAVGTYMSSINQYWNEPMCAQDEVIDLLVAEEMFSYGGACFNGSCQMMDEYGASGVTMFKTWHIFGDPSLIVRTDTPTALNVTHPDVLEPLSSTFEVTVAGVEGALCGLSWNGAYLGSAHADASGLAVIPVSGTLPPEGQSVTLTVTAPNRIPYITPITVGVLLLPDIIYYPDHFEVEMSLGEVLTEYLTIENTGDPGSVLDFTISVMGSGDHWLTVSPQSGQVNAGSQIPVELTFEPWGMAAGSYSCSVIIMNNAGAPVIVPVLLGLDSPVSVADGTLPSKFSVEPNQPNPFRSATSFGIALPAADRVRLEVFDIAGRCVAMPVDEILPPGVNRVTWEARDRGGRALAPGVYYYRVSKGGVTTPAMRMIVTH